MKNSSLRRIIPALLLLAAIGSCSFGLLAQSPIPTNGLIVRLDAAEQLAARTKTGLQPPSNGSPLDRWLNTANPSANAIQMSGLSRPIFRSGEGAQFVHFDGHDDFFQVPGPGVPLEEVTVFVLAAPRTNSGNFSGLFATARASRNDYTDGLNLDFGPVATPELSVINVESAGAQGFRNLLEPGKNLAAKLAFGGFHVFTVSSKVGKNGNQVWLDGIGLGARPRTESKIGSDEMVVGARIYSNDPAQAPFAQSFFNGDIAAVLVYNRALNDSERAQVEKSLFDRTPSLNALISGQQGHALKVVKDPPLVQMLVPGFTVHELPLTLRNLNNVRYRHDGKLVAVTYDGRVLLLSDTDGDGLEDKSEVFWDKQPLRAPVGLALLPKNDPRGDGMIIASWSKVSLILDRDRDGKADEEIVIATGWPQSSVSVDAVGVAIDPKDGSIYFCLGCANYANGYLVDPATGKSGYQIGSERGTIQKISADFKTRETVCTGVRFSCSLGFNNLGDLFATEQEGATWLSNGNPLDELLQIQPNRHYGFPPRHPRHLPQVIDEPAVMEYGPQHQSTVGMMFNDSVNGGPTFGPAFWRGDALVCGESRGKLYRTKLVKTPAGYVAQNQIIACLGMLTIDTCVSPKGDLIIACHSGPPDWGTGPTGEGKLFRIHQAKPEIPQVAAVWAAGPDEFRVAFDKPLNPADWSGSREKIRIEAGQYVSAGDRFEAIRPGYQVVRDQMAAPRRWVEVQSVSLSAEQRTLVLRVARQTDQVRYSITLPVPASWRTTGGIAQSPEMDLAFTLNGISVTIQNGNEPLGVILPHPSIAVANALTIGSADHEEFFRALESAGSSLRITLRGMISVANIFVPAIQPGSSLDWDIAADTFANKRMAVDQDLTTKVAASVIPSSTAGEKFRQVDLSLSGPLSSNGNGMIFSLDDKKRPLLLNTLVVPWADRDGKKPVPASNMARTDVKGNWLAGRRIFFAEAGCATCHMLRNEGISFGPDLSNLVFRDRDSVLTDITKPSATINPDHAGTTIKFKDGTEVNGLLRKLNDQEIVIGQPAGVELKRPRADVLSMTPMKVSLMTDGFAKTLSAAQLEDLLTFLLINPLEPAQITRVNPSAPTARSRAEFASFLPSFAGPATKPAPMRILLSAGPKDHGLDEHDYPRWLERSSKLLALADNVTISTCMGFPSKAQLAAADVVVFCSANPGWDDDAAKLLDEYQARGGGAVYLHWAIEGGKAPMALAERVGFTTQNSAFRHGEVDLEFTDPAHPITRGITNLHILDETYWALKGDPSKVHVLANGVEEGAPRPQLWTVERAKGRVFCSIPGHYFWTFDDPLYRVIVLRGIAWAARDPNVDRFLDLVPVGARFAP